MSEASIVYQDNELVISHSGPFDRTVRLKESQKSQEELSRRVHDLKNALQSLQLVHTSLQQGYRFDDLTAPHKIAYLAKVISTLEKEAELLFSLFQAP